MINGRASWERESHVPTWRGARHACSSGRACRCRRFKDSRRGRGCMHGREIVTGASGEGRGGGVPSIPAGMMRASIPPIISPGVASIALRKRSRASPSYVCVCVCVCVCVIVCDYIHAHTENHPVAGTGMATGMPERKTAHITAHTRSVCTARPPAVGRDDARHRTASPQRDARRALVRRRLGGAACGVCVLYSACPQQHRKGAASSFMHRRTPVRAAAWRGAMGHVCRQARRRRAHWPHS